MASGWRESARCVPDYLVPHQANRAVDRGPQRWRELVAKPTDLVDRGPDEHDFGHRPAREHDRKGGQEMSDSEGVQAELRGGRDEVVHAKATDTADPATGPQRVDDHRLAATLEVTDRTQARESGIKQLHLTGQARSFAKPPEDMDAEAVVALPEIPEADHVDHPASPLIRPGRSSPARSSRSAPCRTGRRRATERCDPPRRGSPGP